MSLDNFKLDVKKIVSLYSISEEHAGCYLCNFEDEYICHKHNGGCEVIEQCRNIREKELQTTNKDRSIKVVYEDCNRLVEIDDCRIEYTRKLSPMESENLFRNMFGTTDVGMIDCSDMSDEEIERIIDKWNSIPN